MHCRAEVGCRYITWKHWVLILSVVLAIALHMVIHSPLNHLGLDAALYVGLPGAFCVRSPALPSEMPGA